MGAAQRHIVSAHTHEATRKIAMCVLLWAVCSICPNLSFSQSRKTADSLKLININIPQSKFINNILQQAVNSVEKPPPEKKGKKQQSIKSETPFLPYQGKIIRNIYINPFNFDQTLKDTTKRDNSRIARIGKRLHYVTKDFVIKDNLFIKENTPLNAYKVADNERHLRTLEFIHDARIIAKSIKNNPDSVDLEVLTIDVFSIAGGFSSNGLNHINSNLFETNLGGMGQRLELDQLHDYNRRPTDGFGVLYRKNNIFHTFIDASAGYNTMSGSEFTNEEETAGYFSLRRQLISPYSHMAGGLTVSHNEAYNLYNVLPTTFYNYKYNLVDAWGGYNLGINKLTANSNNNKRDRKFLALRFYNRHFTNIPYQVSSFNPVYNNSAALLAQFTMFRQDYYRTNYIYGFGTTEDLPYGYNAGITTGWHQQMGLNRYYAGINAFDYIATNKGDFLQVYLKAGGFINHNIVQDGTLLFGVTAFSRIINIGDTKVRQYFNINYSCISNLVTYAPLRINNDYGVRGFLSDSASGTKRLSLQSETEFFLKYNLHGFHFAPFPYIDLSLLTPPGKPFQNSSLYASLGGGVRMRNENLVFETIELRAYFFPVAPNGMNGFKLVLNSNIRYRYINNFITPPDIVKLNSQ